ncbi:MAG: hypothetical protein GY842_22315 [bacterium]|nr:hypothetical protein [bacterium]
MSCLQRLQDEHPRLDPVRWCRARTTQPLGVALVATLASVACSMVEIHPPALRTAELAAVTAVADRSPSDGAPDPERTPEATERLKPPAELSSPDGRQSSGASESGASTSQREEMAGGRAGDGTGAQARASNQAANTRGQSTQAPANAANPSPRDAKTAAPKKPRESRVSDQTQTEAQQDHSSVSQGASGGGAMSVAHNSWSQHAQTAQGDREEEDSDEEVEEDRESSKQRGGVQPSLKDRNESPSRELGISGEDGPPGTGRGGPTPPKKSRGTASLVLGIPIPDFVKGRVGPGTTKVTHERVEPPPMPGHATAVIKVPPRILPETPTRRFEIPAAFAAIARDYLVALHSATSHSDRDAAAESAPPTESSGAAVPDHEE